MRDSFVALLCFSSLLTVARAEMGSSEAFRAAPTLRAPADDTVHEQLFGWLKTAKASDAVQAEVDVLWKLEQAASLSLAERLANCFAIADPRAKTLVDVCSAARRGVKLPNVDWLREAGTDKFEAANLRLLYGRWLAHQRLYDELREQVSDLTPQDVVDPATLLFCQAVAHHQLLDKTEGLKVIDRLLNDVEQVPARYRSLATRMRADLDALDEKNLDHIARRMEDIRRRLDLGRAGEKVVEVEDGVIKSLDKLIEDMEKQLQNQQQGAGSGKSKMMPMAPMQQSRIAELKGPGEVDRKPIGAASGWGDLPPKEREEAMQQIGKDFPAHYRDVVEQYFRSLATQGQRAE